MADWDIIRQVKEAIKIPVIGNGDVVSVETAEKLLKQTNADGVMVGRGSLGNPWLLGQIHEYLQNKILPRDISVGEIKEALLQQLNDMVSFYGKEMAVAISRKYVCWYSKNLRDAKKFREIYTRIYDYDEAVKAIEAYFSKREQGDE